MSYNCMYEQKKAFSYLFCFIIDAHLAWLRKGKESRIIRLIWQPSEATAKTPLIQRPKVFANT